MKGTVRVLGPAFGSIATRIATQIIVIARVEYDTGDHVNGVLLPGDDRTSFRHQAADGSVRIVSGLPEAWDGTQRTVSVRLTSEDPADLDSRARIAKL